jgi:hypothetical protein
VGWKEDFNMSFIWPVPAQKDAVRYLERIAESCPHALRLGGHSKGGNLAVYASVYAREDLAPRILQIYNNDGPGFHRELLRSERYLALEDRIRTLVPQSSVVGMLLEHAESYTVVKSTQTGLFQHDGFSWEVLGASFIKLERVTNGSRLVDGTLHAWMRTLTQEERQEFVDTVFSILTYGNANTLTELSQNRISILIALGKTAPEKKAFLTKALRLLLDQGVQTYRSYREAENVQKKAEKQIRKHSSPPKQKKLSDSKEPSETDDRAMRIKPFSVHPNAIRIRKSSPNGKTSSNKFDETK